jgi:hypothetical protein
MATILPITRQRLFEILPCGDPYNRYGWEIREYRDSFDEEFPIYRGDLSPIKGRDRTIQMLRALYPGCKIRTFRPDRDN